jgi:hypothetical protein
MHSEGVALHNWTGLEIADAALLAVKRAKKCAVCHNPRPPLGLYKHDVLSAWADEMHKLVGNAVISIPRDTRCPVCEADLKAVLCIPDDILVLMHRRLSERQREFLRTRMVVAMCETCCKVNRDETERSIREMYKRAVNRNGADPGDTGLAEEAFGLVAQEINRRKQGYGL